MCDMGHVMNLQKGPTYEDDSDFCDNCGKKLAGPNNKLANCEEYYRCHECDYNLCQLCIEQTLN